MRAARRFDRRPAGRVLPVLLTGLVAACGTTVDAADQQLGGRSPAGLASEMGAAGLSLDQGGGRDDQPAPPGAGTDGTRAGSPNEVTNSPVEQVRDREIATEGASDPPVARGALRPVEIGFVAFETIDYSKFGATGQSTGNTRAFIDIMVAHLNRSGGLAGHPVRPVVHTIDVTQSLETQYQAACSRFTEDHRVVAVATVAQTPESFRACLSRRGVAYAASSLSSADMQLFAAYPGFFQADAANLHVIARTLVVGLADAGYFRSRGGRPVKIGLLHTDSPAYTRAIEQALLPALRDRGLKLDDRAGYPPLDSTAEAGEMHAAMSSAQLRFTSAGVTHVLVLEQQGALTGTFMAIAESQQYRPAYGLTSQSLLQSSLAANYPAAQQAGATAVGWLPVVDVVASDQGRNPARSACLNLYKARGQVFRDANAETGALAYCDSALLLQAAAKRGGSPVTLGSLIAGVDRLGALYRSPSTFAGSFARGRHDAASSYRIVRFTDGCSCYRYRGEVRAFSR